MEQYTLKKNNTVYLFSIDHQSILKNGKPYHCLYSKTGNKGEWKDTEIQITIERMRRHWQTLLDNGFTRVYYTPV